MDHLKKTFIQLIRKYNPDDMLATSLWNEIEKAYSEPGRFYHTLEHIGKMLNIILPHSEKLNDPDAVLFATWYHDMIYDSSRSDNEAQSAEHAERSLQKADVPLAIAEKTKYLILLTKNHSLTEHSSFDERLFMDADLAVLGADPEAYLKYAQRVRKEYQQYPDQIYNPGRKKVLQSFLLEKYIYNTMEVRSLLEKQARANIQSELNQLSL